ncbi:flagellar hook-associated protein FlgL [Nitrosococcus watsonii]|uniref:Flagellar hook-associated protein 3 n=1 Tax=Nitrosococcus watsoni (strain C-113) TaxID=105559 RepID=D8K8C6_NITWC|nr:flagellar hook-associated protein FlgL [Nitrosococcus watsonii]ADJ29046.1 flagellar hook-associated protein 3 [Nitrosococcus watsonii C-113]
MRISTSLFQQQSIEGMLRQQTQVSKTQRQIASGERMQTPADDPVAAARLLEVREASGRTAQFQTNADLATARLSQEENALAGVNNVLQGVRELAVQANNGAQNNENRAIIAQEVRQRLNELVGLANSQDASGEYLFAGAKGRTQPFIQAGGGVSYQGDQAQRLISIGPSAQVADSHSGSEVFLAIREGNGVFATEANPVNRGSGVIAPGSANGAFIPGNYTLQFSQATPDDPLTYQVLDSQHTVVANGDFASGEEIAFGGAQASITGVPADGDSFTLRASAHRDMFTIAQHFIEALERPINDTTSQARFHNDMNKTLTDLDQAMGKVLEVRAETGARLNAVDRERQVNEETSLQLAREQSSLNDLDLAEAIGRLNQQLTGLEAAQRTYARLQGLSLFNFL